MDKPLGMLHHLPLRYVPRLLAWPLPALLSWTLAWLAFMTVRYVVASWEASMWLALSAAMTLGLCCTLMGSTKWRRLMIAAGFPLSWAASTWSSHLPPAAWLLPLALLVLLYPINSWRDAPLFPTPKGALSELPQHIALRPGAQVLDAGCGLGHGLRELHRVYPQAQLLGVEWSWPLRWAAALLCPWAKVKRGDIWLGDWSSFDLVYLFQRPESMPRAYAKAQAELKPGAWLVSLEFPVIHAQPSASITCAPERSVWLYQMPGPAHAGQANQ